MMWMESESEAPSLRKHLLTLTVIHHVQSSVDSTVVAEALNMVQPDVYEDILCHNNKSNNQRDWVKEVERLYRRLYAPTKA